MSLLERNYKGRWLLIPSHSLVLTKQYRPQTSFAVDGLHSFEGFALVFCRLSLNWDLPDVFLTIILGLHVSVRETRVPNAIPSHPIKSINCSLH